MAFFSPRRRVSDTENKLRILFCLDALGMATPEQLWPFVARLELMEYMPFCMFVDELKKDGAIAVGRNALEGALYLTAAGERTLSLFSAKLIHADKERIQKEAAAYAALLNERRQARAVYERAEADGLRVAATVCEGDVPTLFLRLRTHKRALAEAAQKGFPARAPRILTLLYTLPFAPSAQALPVAASQEEALALAESGQMALCAYGGHEHGAAVCLRAADAAYTALLLLPSRESAQGWCLAAQAQGEALADKLTALLASEGSQG